MKKGFHTLSIKESLKALDASQYGLFENEAKERLKKHGKNKISFIRENVISIFFRQFSKPLFFILTLLVAYQIFLENLTEAIFVAILGLIYGLYSFFFEVIYRRNQKKIENFTEPLITVIRDGKSRKVPISEITVGDVIHFKKGDYIPADVRLIQSKNLIVDERIITGETIPVEKEADVVLDKKTPLEERKNLVFTGSYIFEGEGKGVVYSIGKKTEFYKLYKGEKNFYEKSKLKRNIKIFSIIWFFVILALLASYIAYTRFYGDIYKDFPKVVNFSFSTTIIGVLDAILIMALFSLTVGIIYISRKHILIKNPVSAEKLPSVEYMVIDKEGVITEDKYEVKGYKGSNLYLLMLTSALCNKASDIEGNPIERATVNWLTDKKFNWKLARNKYKKVSEFKDEKLGIEVSVHQLKDRYFSFVKGSFDGLWLLSKNKSEEFISWYEELSSQGLKVVAYGFGESEKIPESVKELRIELLGFIGFINEIKEDVVEYIKELRKAGIKIILITEDDIKSAIAFGKEIGIYQKDDLTITALKMKNYSEEELFNILKRATIVAEAKARDKFEVVKILKWNKKKVLTTGKDINDVSTLRVADVGVVDTTNYEALKDVAGVLIEDLKLSKLSLLLKTAQFIRKKVKNIVSFISTTTIYGTMVIGTPFFLNIPLPLNPIQILWLKLFSVILPSRTIPLGKYEKENLEKPKKRIVFTFSHILDILNTLIVAYGLNLVLFLYIYKIASYKEASSTLFLSMSLTNMVLAIMYASPMPVLKNPIRYILSNLYIYPIALVNIVSLLVAFYVLSPILGIEKINIDNAIYVSAPPILTFLIAEISKWIDSIGTKTN